MDIKAPEEVLFTVPQALERLLAFPSTLGWIFRGQANSRWPLLPRAGREPYYRRKPISPPADIGRLNHWRQLAVGYHSNVPVPSNLFEAMAHAQHYGLPTRLLDWTESALTALYFACSDRYDEEGALYAYFADYYVNNDVNDYAAVKRVSRLRVAPFDRRLLAQEATFVYFPNPRESLKPAPIAAELGEPSGVNLLKFSIPADFKTHIMRQLRELGVTRKLLFPDLDGLSQSFVEEFHRTDAFKRRAAVEALEYEI
ncbi:MAG TPA: FRG domain-containing protein [Methylomirabilota bacterium]|nr:FRG domain-containing protein [Methylomirabilota bacterium]